MQRGVPPKKRCLLRVRASLQKLFKSISVAVSASFMHCLLCNDTPKFQNSTGAKAIMIDLYVRRAWYKLAEHEVLPITWAFKFTIVY